MIGEYIKILFGNNVALAVILMSMIPLIEIKGAIPFGVSVYLWGEYSLSTWQSFILSILGGIIITTLLVIIFRPIYSKLKSKKFFKKIIDFFTSDINKTANRINENEKEIELKDNRKSFIKKMFAIILFVAIPVPGTGVYTGTVLAILLKFNIWQTILFVTIGNIITGIIITTICVVFPAITDILLVAFLIGVALFLLFRIITSLRKENNTTNV